MIGLPALARTQDAETPVRLITPDGVSLRGYFMPGTKKSPCVFMLHDLGERRLEKPWRQFADLMQKNGFAVLQLDFRGHGRSTEVDADVFWSPLFGANRKFVKSKAKDEIAFDDFDPAYHPFLLNDIATGKAFLDRKNDGGECNSSNVVLVCPGQSGALGAAWINAESNRYRQLPPPFLGAPIQLANESQARHILGVMFMNLSPRLGKQKLALAAALKPAARRDRLPAVFFHGSEDAQGRAIAIETERAINPGGKNALTGVTEIADAGPDDVEKRVVSDKNLCKDVVRYLKQLHDERGQEWEDHKSRDTVYYWRNPYAPAALIRFNPPGGNDPPFASYELFLPRR